MPLDSDIIQINRRCSVAVMQPYWMPYLGYFKLIQQVDKFIFLDDVQYIKGGWINRNRFLVGGQERYFTLPVKYKFGMKINEVGSGMNEHMKSKLLKTFDLNYKKFPGYGVARDILSNSLDLDTDRISDIAMFSVRSIASFLGIKTEYFVASKLHVERKDGIQDNVINLVKSVGGQLYFNMQGGQSLYSQDYFNLREVDLSFVSMNVDERIANDWLYSSLHCIAKYPKEAILERIEA